MGNNRNQTGRNADQIFYEEKTGRPDLPGFVKTEYDDKADQCTCKTKKSNEECPIHDVPLAYA